MLARMAAGERKHTPRILAHSQTGAPRLIQSAVTRMVPFAHAEHQQIRAGIHQNARPDGVIPVIVMREAAERGFHAADGDGNIAVSLANQAAIDIDRAIRPLGRLAAGVYTSEERRRLAAV